MDARKNGKMTGPKIPNNKANAPPKGLTVQAPKKGKR